MEDRSSLIRKMNEVREKDRMLFYEIMFQEEEAASTQTLR